MVIVLPLSIKLFVTIRSASNALKLSYDVSTLSTTGNLSLSFGRFCVISSIKASKDCLPLEPFITSQTISDSSSPSNGLQSNMIPEADSQPISTSPTHSQSHHWDAAGILACLWWAAQSVALVLANKAIFSQPLFDFPWLIITVQCLVVVFAFSLVAVLRREPPTIRFTHISNMLIPSALFLLYHYSNARALRFISLPAYTVVKSLAPLGVTTIERIALGNSIPSGVYAALGLSLLGNVFTFDSASAISQTSMLGYVWSIFNVSTHIFYVLSLRYCGGNYRTTDKAFIANLLALPIALGFAIANQELGSFSHEITLLPSSTRIPLVFSFALSAGCLVSVLSAFEAASSDALRYLAQTNKIAIVLLGAAIFQTKFTPHAWFGVVLAVASGFLFVYAKSKSNTATNIPRPIVSSPTLELLLPTDDNTDEERGLPREQKHDPIDDILKNAA